MLGGVQTFLRPLFAQEADGNECWALVLLSFRLFAQGGESPPFWSVREAVTVCGGSHHAVGALSNDVMSHSSGSQKAKIRLSAGLSWGLWESSGASLAVIGVPYDVSCLQFHHLPSVCVILSSRVLFIRMPVTSHRIQDQPDSSMTSSQLNQSHLQQYYSKSIHILMYLGKRPSTYEFWWNTVSKALLLSEDFGLALVWLYP